jgi:hypothetical protein
VNLLRTAPDLAPKQSFRVKAGRWGGLALSFIAAAILVHAAKQPYWIMRLKAPQYPQGLALRVYLDHVEGDVDEVNTLNHYIGVKHIDEGAKLERAIGIPAVYLLAGCLLLAPFAGRKKLALLAIPAIGFPAGFVLDLAYWMHRLSTELDPHAPVHLKAFSFSLAGDAKVGQFMSHTAFTWGFAFAVVAAIAALGAVVLREILACRACPHRATCGLVCKGALPWTPRS